MQKLAKTIAVSLIVLSACGQDRAPEPVTTSRSALTVSIDVVDNGAFVGGWTTWNATPTTSTTITLNGEPSMCFSFSQWLMLSMCAPQSLPFAATDRIKFDVWGGTYSAPKLALSLGESASFSLTSAHCSPAIATGQWSRCDVAVSSLGGARTTDYFTITNAAGAVMPSICFVNMRVRPALQGTGGAPSTGGAAATGGAATGGSAATGGTSTGGAATGGSPDTGGASTGGAATGGDQSTGGAVETGGTSTGGNASAGAPAVSHMPRISVGKPAFASHGDASKVNDGGINLGYMWEFSGCSVSSPCWAAINIGTGPSTLILQLDNDTGDQYSTSASVHDYSIAVSSDSTNGANGTWTSALDAISGLPVAVSGNTFLSRSHKIAFTGSSWLKLRITSSGTSALNEIEVWDASLGSGDTYLNHGDSISSLCGQRSTAQGFDEQPSLQAHFTGWVPMFTVAGTSGGWTDLAVSVIDEYLAANTGTKHLFLAYGTNDLNWTSVASYSASVQQWINKVVAAGRTPILVHVPWANNSPYYGAGNEPDYNDALDALAAANGLLPPVPLYEATVNHSNYYWSSDVHLNHVGCTTAWGPTFASYIQEHELY